MIDCNHLQLWEHVISQKITTEDNFTWTYWVESSICCNYRTSVSWYCTDALLAEYAPPHVTRQSIIPARSGFLRIDDTKWNKNDIVHSATKMNNENIWEPTTSMQKWRQTFIFWSFARLESQRSSRSKSSSTRVASYCTVQSRAFVKSQCQNLPEYWLGALFYSSFRG